MSHILQSSFTRALKLKYPIVQAPCAGHTGVELITAVSNAGGLGSLGAGMMPVDLLRKTIRNIRNKTSNPFAVNLFCRPAHIVSETDLQRHCPGIDDTLDIIRTELNIPIPTEYKLRSPPLEDQLAVILEERVPVVSFTFGVLPDHFRDQLWAAGTYLIGTATTLQEALMLAGLDPSSPTRKADAIVAQGLEAGGHRGSFLANGQQLSRIQLVKSIKQHVSLPILAAGGISTGTDVSHVLQKEQADAAVIGTLFMLATESTTPKAHREHMIHAEKKGLEPTRITTAITGKHVRSYPNELMKRIEQAAEESDVQVPEYSIHSSKTKDIAEHATKHHLADYMLLLAGANASEAVKYTKQGTLSAKQIIDKIVSEIK
ncbi:2-nitropropane dioxygenase [Choanephora cucurbitarum]|nr:2-nitropropane dioxygenase [Choanephora cucurbitarum]